MTRFCRDCGTPIPSHKHFCQECRDKRLKISQGNAWKKYRKTHSIGLAITKDPCENILKKHHDDLKDDPERLSTKFIADVAGCSCRIVKKNVEERTHA
jgi:hypothetical protein